MFQQLLARKHHRLCDSKFGRVKAWVWSPTNQKKKPRVNHEPRSAHGRAVKKKCMTDFELFLISHFLGLQKIFLTDFYFTLHEC